MRTRVFALVAAALLAGCDEEDDIIAAMAKDCKEMPPDPCGTDRLRQLPCPHDKCDSINDPVDCPLTECTPKILDSNLFGKLTSMFGVDGAVTSSAHAKMTRFQNILPGHDTHGGPATCPARYVGAQATYDADVLFQASASASVTGTKGTVSAGGKVLTVSWKKNGLRCTFVNHSAPLTCTKT